MTKLRDIAVGIDPIEEDMTGGVIYERFRAEPDLIVIGVVDPQGVPVGLIERNHFSLQMASTYGRALYAGRPISLVMDKSPLVVDAEALVADFTEEALARRPSDLMKGIIVVSNGRYSGVATVTALLKAITDQSREDAQALATLAGGLSEAKAEVLSANTLLREALDAMSEGVAIFDADDRCVLWNAKYSESHRESSDVLKPGTAFEDILRHGVERHQYIEALGREEAWSEARLARRAALVDRISEEQALPDSRFIRVEDSRLPSGGSISVAVDVTEIKRREASFRFLFDNNPVPLAVIDRSELRFLAVNDSAAAQYGYPREAMTDMTVLDVLAPEEAEAASTGLRGPDWDGVQTEGRSWRHVTSAGETFSIRPYMRPLTYGDRAAILVAALDVTAQESAENSLKLALEQAESANRAKSEFLANMSHEIRTPLNGVLGVVSVLAKTKLTARQSDMIGIVETSARTLQALLDDLLDIAKIESGQLDLQERVMQPAAIARHVASLFEGVSAEKNLEFRVLLDEGAHQPVLADQTRIAQIITNLCSNAVKFTDKGSVTLSIESEPLPDAQRLTIAVADTGIGISETGRARLFERFSQADGSITRRFGGTGLGLAISQQLANMMGGEISVTSVEGEGSRFAFTLEFPRVEPALDAIQTADDGGANDEVPASATQTGLRVLLVEDHPVNRKVVELIIGEAVELTFAENGKEGVDAEAAQSFDLILMDMQMPVMDGLTATRLIRQRERQAGAKRTPIMILTANVLREHVEACLQAGADAHLSKPIAASALIAAMEDALADSPALKNAEAA